MCLASEMSWQGPSQWMGTVCAHRRILEASAMDAWITSRRLPEWLRKGEVGRSDLVLDVLHARSASPFPNIYAASHYRTGGPPTKPCPLRLSGPLGRYRECLLNDEVPKMRFKCTVDMVVGDDGCDDATLMSDKSCSYLIFSIRLRFRLVGRPPSTRLTGPLLCQLSPVTALPPAFSDSPLVLQPHRCCRVSQNLPQESLQPAEGRDASELRLHPHFHSISPVARPLPPCPSPAPSSKHPTVR